MDCFVTLNTLAIYPLKEKVFLLERTAEICSTFLCLWRCYVVWSMKSTIRWIAFYCISLPLVQLDHISRSNIPYEEALWWQYVRWKEASTGNGCSSWIVVLHWDTSWCYCFDSFAGVAFVVGIECLRQLILRGVIPNKSDIYSIW